MRNEILFKTKTIFFVLFLTLFLMSGCGAVHSEAVKKLVKSEVSGLENVDGKLNELENTVEKAIADLKQSNKLRVENLQIWENEIKKAKIVSSAPGILSDPVIRDSVLKQIAQLEIDRVSAYSNLERDFNTQADKLLEAYRKILKAVLRVKTELNTIDNYVNQSTLTFAAESLDTETIKLALSDFEEAKGFLESAAKAGKLVEKGLGYAKFVDRESQMGELVQTLSLLSSKVQKLKPEEINPNPTNRGSAPTP